MGPGLAVVFRQHQPLQQAAAIAIEGRIKPGHDGAIGASRQPRGLSGGNGQHRRRAPGLAGVAAKPDAVISHVRRTDGGVEIIRIADIGGQGRHGDVPGAGSDRHGLEAGAGIRAAVEAAGGGLSQGFRCGGKDGAAARCHADNARARQALAQLAPRCAAVAAVKQPDLLAPQAAARGDAGAGDQNVGRGWISGEAGDRQRALVVAERCPARAAVARRPYAAIDRADVHGVRIRGIGNDRLYGAGRRAVGRRVAALDDGRRTEVRRRALREEGLRRRNRCPGRADERHEQGRDDGPRPIRLFGLNSQSSHTRHRLATTHDTSNSRRRYLGLVPASAEQPACFKAFPVCPRAPVPKVRTRRRSYGDPQTSANVCIWHKTDVTWAWRGVRFQGKSGHDVDWQSRPSLTRSGHGGTGYSITP